EPEDPKGWNDLVWWLWNRLPSPQDVGLWGKSRGRKPSRHSRLIRLNNRRRAQQSSLSRCLAKGTSDRYRVRLEKKPTGRHREESGHHGCVHPKSKNGPGRDIEPRNLIKLMRHAKFWSIHCQWRSSSFLLVFASRMHRLPPTEGDWHVASSRTAFGNFCFLPSLIDPRSLAAARLDTTIPGIRNISTACRRRSGRSAKLPQKRWQHL